MLLKRHYDLPSGFKDWDDWKARGRKMDKRGRVLNLPKVKGIDLLSLGQSPNWNVSPNLLNSGLRDGWLSLKDGVLTLHSQNKGDVRFNVVRNPGYYCCHCGMHLEDSASAREHVAEEHAGEESPDRNNPSGYELASYYACVEADPRKGV
jgi:hypothetical protein